MKACKIVYNNNNNIIIIIIIIIITITHLVKGYCMEEGSGGDTRRRWLGTSSPLRFFGLRLHRSNCMLIFLATSCCFPEKPMEDFISISRGDAFRFGAPTRNSPALDRVLHEKFRYRR